MSSRLHGLLAMILATALAGCESSHSRLAPPAAITIKRGNEPIDLATRNNALSLLADLLKDEKDLSKILIIKRESLDLNRLVKDISETARAGAKMLAAAEQQENHLHLAGTGLPPGEDATRKAIAKTKQSILLHDKGENFELQLLLTQTEALNYGAHLAQVAAENEPKAGRAQDYASLAAQMRRLHGQTVAMLRVKP